MIYATSLYDERVECWETHDCRGYHAKTPLDAALKRWSHCWLNDSYTDDDNIKEWLDGEDTHAAIHVIARDGKQSIVTFDVIPIGFKRSRRGKRRRIVWKIINTKTRACPKAHASKYQARWTWVSKKHIDDDIREGGNDWSELHIGWYIDHFCEAQPCRWCLELTPPVALKSGHNTAESSHSGS